MSTDVRSAIRSWLPRWIQPLALLDEGFRVLYAIGLVIDATKEAMLQAAQSDLPEYCDTSCLPRIGRDRKIRRAPAEPDGTYEQRLIRWIDDHKTQGNPYTLLEQLRAFFYPYTPRMQLVNANGTWYQIDTDGTRARFTSSPSNWDWDGKSAALPHRCWVIIHAWSAPGLVDRDGTWGDGETWGTKPDSTWGCTFTYEQVEGIRQLIDDWRSATALYVNVIIVFDAADTNFQPATGITLNPGKWGDGVQLVGGVWVGTRSTGAIYIDGVAA